MRKKLFRRIPVIVSLLAVASLLSILTVSPVLAATVPVIANLDGDSVTYQENAAAVKIDNGGDATVTDDGTGYNGGNVTLAITNSTANDNFGVDGVNVLSGGDATIAAGETINVSGTDIGTVDGTDDGQGGNDLVINLTALAADGLLSTLLQNITFANVSENPNTTARTVAVTVADNADGPSLVSTVTVNITAVNDRPVVGNLNGDSVNVAAGGPPVAIDQNGNATVTDIDSADFNGGNLTVTQTAGTVNGNFGVDGTNVTSGGDATIVAGETINVGATAIGTVHAVNDGQGGNDLVITFNTADATPANVQTLIRNLTYSTPSNGVARTFDLTVNDGDGTANGGQDTSVAATFTLNILPPEMNVMLDTTNIADGGNINIGIQVINTFGTYTFTIQNTGTGILNLTNPPVLGGADAAMFSIVQQPTTPVAAGNNTTFVLGFTPSTAGAKTATLSITNNDSDENPYNFTIQATGYYPSQSPGPGTTIPTTYVTGGTLNLNTNGYGQVQQNYNYTSDNGVLNFSINAGTTARDGNNNPLTSITATVVSNPPPPPPGVNIVGPVFNLSPSGAAFTPGLTLTFTYDDADIPPGVAETSLTIAFYNEATGQWTVLQCTVDPATNTITATGVDHFTNFTITGESPPPAPAEFSVANLTISPTESQTGETVTVSVAVANSGGTAGDYAVTLTVNGAVIDTTTVTLAAGGTGNVDFTLSGQPAGTYDVNVNGLTGSYTVTEPPAEPEPTTPVAPEETTPTPTETMTPTETTPPATPTPTPTTALPPQAEEEGFASWWWIVIGAGIVVIGLIIWMSTRRQS